MGATLDYLQKKIAVLADSRDRNARAVDEIQASIAHDLKYHQDEIHKIDEELRILRGLVDTVS